MTHSRITESDWKYPQPLMLCSGMLDVSDSPKHSIYWREYGDSLGEPVVVVHGGPGGACQPEYARFFNPERYRIVLFDQRGCGKSRPNAADSRSALEGNTTTDLIEDIQKLRCALGIKDRMHLFGGSWGSTLSLAYAIAYPENIASLCLRGIFLCRKQDLDYFYQGNAADLHDYSIAGAYASFPEAWKTYVEVIPAEKRHDMIAAYADIFAMHPKTAEEYAYQDRAAIAWSVWEGSTCYLTPEKTVVDTFANPEFAKAFARIENHYFMHGAFLGGKCDRNQNFILEHLDCIKHIPIQIVHGRYDQVCPLMQAEELVAGLKAVGSADVIYRITTAGHSMLERETHAVLTEFMDRVAPARHAAKVTD